MSTIDELYDDFKKKKKPSQVAADSQKENSQKTQSSGTTIDSLFEEMQKKKKATPAPSIYPSKGYSYSPPPELAKKESNPAQTEPIKQELNLLQKIGKKGNELVDTGKKSLVSGYKHTEASVKGFISKSVIDSLDDPMAKQLERMKFGDELNNDEETRKFISKTFKLNDEEAGKLIEEKRAEQIEKKATADEKTNKVVADSINSALEASIDAAKFDKENSPIVDSEKFIDKIRDPNWLVYTVGQGLPNLLAQYGISGTVLALTKNPATAAKVGFGTSFVLESGSAYNDALEFGVDPKTASNLATINGLVNASFETLPLGRFLNKGPQGQAIKRSIFKKLMAQMVSATKQGVLEGGTESIQQMVSNSIAQTYDEEREFFAGVPESALAGFVLGGGADTVQAGTSAILNRNESQPPADLSAKQLDDYVAAIEAKPEEQRTADEVQFLNDIKDTEGESNFGKLERIDEAVPEVIKNEFTPEAPVEPNITIEDQTKKPEEEAKNKTYFKGVGKGVDPLTVTTYDDGGAGVYITQDKSHADAFKGDGNTETIILKDGLKLLDQSIPEQNQIYKDVRSKFMTDPVGKERDVVATGVKDELTKLGYDGIVFAEDRAGETVVFDPKNLSVKKEVETTIENSLSQEATKYKSAEEFVKAKGIDPDSVLIKDSKNFVVENSAGNDALLTELPVSFFGKPKFTTLNQFRYEAGRKIIDPIEATIKDGKLTITDGANRFTQAKANGDKTIPVIIDNFDGSLPTQSQLTDIWNKANNVEKKPTIISKKAEITPTSGGVKITPIDESVKIEPDEKTNTATIQPERVSDSSEIRQPDNRERDSKTDEGTLNDETTSSSESGAGPKRDRSPVGKVGRLGANSEAEAVLVAHNYSTDASDYTQEEIKKLKLYSGAGGKESAGAGGKGLLSEYYTPPEVVDKVWEIIDNLTPSIISTSAEGPTNALEPSIGIGTLLNDGMRNGFHFEAYEYQKVSGTIAKILNPDIDVHIGNGEEFSNPGNFETHEPKGDKDLVIGNPPFGERASFLKGKGNEPKINRWEEYFIKRGLDSLRPDGLLVYVVNSSFLNKEISFGKEQIIKEGELVQAFRLPEGIFADTSIGTDIVVFRKRPPLAGKDSNERLELQKRERLIVGDNYFINNPDNIAGTLETRTNRFGQEETYTKGTIKDVENLNTKIDLVEKTVSKPKVVSEKPLNNKFYIAKRSPESLSETVFEEVKGEKIEIEGVDDVFVAKVGNKARGYTENWTVTEGKTGMMIASGKNRQEAIDKTTVAIKQAGEVAVKEKIAEHIAKRGISPRYSKKEIFAPKPLKAKDESYAIKTIKRVKSQSKEGNLPAVIVPDKKSVEVVPRQTIGGAKIVDPVEIKLLKSTNVDGSVEFSSEAKKYLNYYQGKYFHDVNYFSGDIYQKIQDLEADKQQIISELGQEQFDKQLAGLEKVKPPFVNLAEIQFDPMDRYVSDIEVQPADGNNSAVKIKNQFISFLNNTDSALSYGVDRYDIRNYVMGFRASSGSKNKMGAIKSDANRLYNYFIKNVLDEELQTKIVDKFNEEKNSYVNPDYSKIPVEILGMAKFFRGKAFSLSPTQASGVSFLTNKGVGLVAYGVGVGKTHTMMVATMVSHEKGWNKRPVFIVPKSTITKTWIGTIKSMFPNKTIINLGGLNKPDVARLEKARGKDKTKWIRDGEISVMTHEGLLKLALTPEELESATGDLRDALQSETKTERAAQVQEGKMQEIVGRAQYKAGDINISELGFDHISVDEVHNFRKIFQGAKPEAVLADGTVDKSVVKRFGNVIGGTPSKQAQQLFLIAQYILKKNDNRGVYLASATPFENHATEVYNILSLVARDRMRKIGISNINDFFALFSNFETEIEKSIKGEWTNKEKMKSFKNLPQLQKLLREFVDYQVDKTLVRPDKKVLTPSLQMSPLQEENLALIQELIKPSDGSRPEDGSILKASTYSVANAISPYFIKEWHEQIVSPDELIENSPKLKYSMELVKKLKANPKTSKYGTFIYIGANGVDYHNHLVSYAVKNLGFKPAEVAVINGTTQTDEREAIKDDFNEGKIKLLIGGDPTKEGIDLQNNGYATINVAMGWNPTEIEQVSGRIWRQGNKRSIAPIIYPLVENSGDITIFNKFEEKGGRINDLFSYRGQIFDVGELDPQEKKLALMTNPEDKANLKVEIDKVEIQNQQAIISTDISNLKRIRTQIEQKLIDKKYFETRIATKQTNYGTDLDKEAISSYKKELIKVNREIKTMEAFLARKNIKDVDVEIEKLEKQKEKVGEQLVAVSATFKKLLTKFTNEYNDMVAKRKTIDNHVEDFFESTKDLKELSDAEVAAKKIELVKNLEEQSSGSYGAAIGKFADIENLSDASKGMFAEIDNLTDNTSAKNTIPFPEMVRIARDLTGKIPQVKKLRGNARGRAYPNSLDIKLDPSIFADPQQAAKTLAHEIGHITDYLPETTKRTGNLIGRITSLQKYLKHTFGELKNKEIRDELTLLSEKWRPYDKNVAKDSFIKYRNSPSELYADAISVLFNDPVRLKQEAPIFWREFFKHLDKKPTAKQNFFDIWALLNKSDEEIYKARQADILDQYAKGEEKFKSLLKERKLKNKSVLFRIKSDFVDKYTPVIEKVNQAKKKGVVADETNPIYLLQENTYLAGQIKAFVETKFSPVYKDLIDNGISWEDFGTVLQLERAINERGELANPLGFTPETAQQQLDGLQKELGDEKWQLVSDNLAKFRTAVKDVVDIAGTAGLYKPELVAQMKANPAYATFQVIDYMDTNISSSIKKQVGTLKEIANPATSTIVKAISTIAAAKKNEARQSIVGLHNDFFSDEITPARTKKIGKLTEFIEPKDPNFELFKLMESGELRGYYLDRYVVESLDYMDTHNTNVAVSALKFMNSKAFNPLFISWNLGFQSFNFQRDFMRAIKNYPSANIFTSFSRVLTGYGKSIKPAYARAFGKDNTLIQEMEEKGILSVTYNDVIKGMTDEDQQINYVLEKSGIESFRKTRRRNILSPLLGVVSIIEKTGNLIETLPKAAAYQQLKGTMPEKELGSFVRTSMGSPDFLAGGRSKNSTNAIFLFSNAIIQGNRADYNVAFKNPRTRAGYWWKTTILTIAPKLIMFAGAAGLFGDWLRDRLEDVSEYDKTNYLIIPIGEENGKTIYIRIPQDESGRLIGGIFWKGINTAINIDGVPKKFEDATDLVSFLGGQVPGLSPVLKAIIGTGQFAAGINPYDFYRNRTAIKDSDFKAGGWARLKPFLMWQFQNLGGSSLIGYSIKEQTGTEKAALQKALELPVVSNILGRWIKVTNYGQVEKNIELQNAIEQQKAAESNQTKQRVDDAIEKYVNAASIFEKQAILRDLVKEELGFAGPYTGDDKEQANRLIKKVKIGKLKAEDDPIVNSVIYSTTNAEKVAILLAYKSRAKDEDYKDLIKKLYSNKVISDNVIKDLKK